MFIWDQLEIWNRLIPDCFSYPGWKCHKHLQLLYELSGILLGNSCKSSASEVVAGEETIYPTSTHGKLLISAVTHGGVHLFHHRLDHFAGRSLPVCCNSSPYVYLKLLSSLLPASSRQPGPVAVLLGQTLKLTFIFSPISHSLGVDREVSSGCFSRVFLCIFYDREFEFQVILLIFLLHWTHGDHQCDTDWQKASTTREKGEEEKRAVLVVTSSSLIF